MKHKKMMHLALTLTTLFVLCAFVGHGFAEKVEGNVNNESIAAVSVGLNHIIGLKADGTVAASGDNSFGECDVDSLANIVAVSAGSLHTVGLKADGTVLAVGDNYEGQCEVSSWTDR